MSKMRETRYADRFHIGVDSSIAARVREASDRYRVAEAVILRRAIDVGLDRAVNAVRKEAAARAARAARRAE